jgi:putative ABC transport system substrate-binding protein
LIPSSVRTLRGRNPVAAGLVATFARPGGNLTGVSFMLAGLTPKRLELLSELVPPASVFALLVNPNNPMPSRQSEKCRKPRA